MSAASSRIETVPMRVLRWWARHELPKKHVMLRRAGVWDDRLWAAEPARTCRGAWHGYRMKLEVREFHQRGAYFFGRMLDVAVPLCLRRAMRAGDTCLDVGANIGMTALVAARVVGAQGRVLAFEPNPEIYRRLLWHIEENRLAQVQPFNMALSDAEGSMRLSVPAANCGAATLGQPPARLTGRIGATHEVAVRIGDDLLPELPAAPMFIKMDVEGHETMSLRGLRRTIERHAPAVLLECNVEMLPRNGTSVDELVALMEGFGYRAYHVGAAWRRATRRWQLVLHEMPRGGRPRRTINALFLRPGGVHESRLARFIANSRTAPKARPAGSVAAADVQGSSTGPLGPVGRGCSEG